MDEIALLQAQLAAVQQQESALKLSDHNVIDLLAKLQAVGKIAIIHTLAGKQIVTPRQLEREVVDHVTLHGGRVAVTELAQALSVDRTYVERALAQLTRGSSQYQVVNNGEELVTAWYLDAIMEDTNTLLQETGTVTIGELAQQFGFAVEYMREVVRARIGSILRAQERGHALYTESFVASQRAQIRGVFAAITRPTFVPELVRSYGFDERVVDEYVAELLARRVLLGTLRGREYVPFVFIDAQRESMFSFFQQNGYLDHARALQLQVTRPFEFLKRRFPDAIPLEHCVVAHALEAQVDGAIDVAVHDGAYVDVRTVLPSAIPQSDIAMLVRRVLGAGSGDALQVAEGYVVSRALVNTCVEMFRKDAATKAQRAASTQQQQQRSKSVKVKETTMDGRDDDEDYDEDGDAGRGRGRKAKGKTAKAATEPEAPSDRRAGKRGKAAKQEDAPKASTKGAKSKRGKRGGGGGTEDAIETRQEPAMSITPSFEEMSERISEAYPDMDGDDELLTSLVEHIQGDVEAIYASALSTALSSILRGDAASLRDLRKKFEDRFDELVVRLACLEKGVNKLSLAVDAEDKGQAEQLQAIEIHLLETTGRELATLVTSFVAAAHNLEMDDDVPALDLLTSTASAPTDVVGADGSTTTTAPADQHSDSQWGHGMTALSEANKKALEKALSPSTAAAIVRLWTFATAGRRSLGDFVVHLPVVAEALSMPLRKLDRKREKQLIFLYRHQVIVEMETTADEDYAGIVALVAQLFFQQTTGLPLALPWGDVSPAEMVLTRVFAATTPGPAIAEFAALVRLARILVASEDDEETTAEARDAWSGALEGVRELVIAKDLAAALAARAST